MVAFGFGVYFGLASFKSKAAQRAVSKPVTKTRTLVPLAGVVFMAQGEALSRLENGQFSEIKPGPGDWTQPTSVPQGGLIAVSRQLHFSDLYLLDGSGHPVRQLTKNQTNTVETNHWAFYPNLSPDGKTLFYSYDPKDLSNTFRVDLAVWSMPLQGTQAQGRRRTTPSPYTGGDVQPLSLSSGAVIYTKYGIDDAGHSQKRELGDDDELHGRILRARLPLYVSLAGLVLAALAVGLVILFRRRRTITRATSPARLR